MGHIHWQVPAHRDQWHPPKLSRTRGWMSDLESGGVRDAGNDHLLASAVTPAGYVVNPGAPLIRLKPRLNFTAVAIQSRECDPR